MSIYCVDYPWSHPGGAALQAAGVKAALRYLSHDAPKTLQRPEADDLHAHGIAMGVVYEDTATRASDGHQAGVTDALNALKMTKGQLPGYTDLAMPQDRPIFFAVDFDATWTQVSDYLAGAGLAIGKQRVGVYGGRNIIDAAYAAGYRWLWQAYAWSDVGNRGWSPVAQIRQQLATTDINGVQCDVDIAVVPDFGQWYPDQTVEDIVTPQDKQDIIDGVYNKIFSGTGREEVAYSVLWYLAQMMTTATPPSWASADMKALWPQAHNVLATVPLKV
jgi:hypothetical protein